jgi:hypothetical protein
LSLLIFNKTAHTPSRFALSIFCRHVVSPERFNLTCFWFTRFWLKVRGCDRGRDRRFGGPLSV